eukprot:31380-Pelagococcus_subviridis.AAC.10
MSSTTWNASPMSCAYFPKRSTSSSFAPAKIAPEVTDTSRSAPRLQRHLVRVRAFGHDIHHLAAH